MNEEEENEMLAKLREETAAIDGEIQFVELNCLEVLGDYRGGVVFNIRVCCKRNNEAPGFSEGSERDSIHQQRPTHNFIHQRLVDELNLSITRRQSLELRLGMEQLRKEEESVREWK